MAQKDNFFADNPDIRFQLTKRIDFEALFAGLSPAEREASGCATADEYRDMSVTVLESMGEVCGSVLGPNAAKVEAEPITLADGEVTLPPTLVANVATLLELGTASMGMNPRWGGLGVPFLLEVCANELIMRGCPSTGLNLVWYSAIAQVVEKFGSEAVKQLVLPKIAAGEWSGSMALTEPDAGSDLAALRTYGDKQPDGTYKLYGTKRFISNGASQVCLVLAMNERGAKGLNNLNLYLCLRKVEGKDNYRVTKIEEKLGLHGSATCELTFDGADAVLLGEPNKGFQHMLHLMNDARIAVAFQGVGYMEAIYRMAADFASQRQSWGKPIAQHELIAEKLLDMEVEVKALRSFCYQAGFDHSIATLGERQLKTATLDEAARTALEKRVAKAKRRVRRATPLVKWYSAETAVRMARDNLQIHGGYGYTKEYRAEWWVRESLILPLYEGTSQIQALMCVKDTLKDVIRNPRRFIEGALGLNVQRLRAGDPLRKKLYRAKQLEKRAVISILLRLLKENVRTSISEAKSQDLLRMIKMLSRDLIKMENVGPALQHAERLCEIKALVALSQCLVLDAEADESRRYLAERFLNKSWPRLNLLKDEIEMDDPVIAERLAMNEPVSARAETSQA
jgi:alkylation response protein AidB-like acyl-CoA dehydrogenase